MINNTTSVKNLIQAFNDNPIVIHRIYLKLTNDYATAAALAQVLYWHKKMGKKFYKIDDDFCDELCLTPKQFKRVKTALKELPFLKLSVEQVPPKSFYDVDYDVLSQQIEKIEQGQIESYQKGQIEPAQKGQIEPAQKGQNNTETKTEITTEPNNNNSDVALDVSIFTKKAEQTAAKKILSPLPIETQQSVLAVFYSKLKTSVISNKIGYLRAIAESAKDGRFTQLSEPIKPITAAERIANEERKAKERVIKIDNDAYFADLAKKYGVDTLKAAGVKLKN
jgi:hypothetical protein